MEWRKDTWLDVEFTSEQVYPFNKVPLGAECHQILAFYQERTGHLSFCSLMAVELFRSEPEAGGLSAECCVVV